MIGRRHRFDDPGDGDDVGGSHDVAEVRYQLGIDVPEVSSGLETTNILIICILGLVLKL